MFSVYIKTNPVFFYFVLLTILLICCNITNIITIYAQSEKTSANGTNDTNKYFEMLNSMVPAIVAAVASIIAAIIAAWNQFKLKKIEEIKAEQDARREYEYEARKRLYHEFEPLILLLNEDSDSAYNHIKELANMARFGKLYARLSQTLGDNQDRSNEYYLKITIYKLILPMAVFRLMQRRLTFFDIYLDNYFRIHYELAKCLYFSCANSYYIALGGKKLEDYKQCLICKFNGLLKHGEEEKDKRTHPNHIVINILEINEGTIDSLANSLIKFDDNDKIYRIISFDEFNNECFKINECKSIKKMYEIFSIKEINENKLDYLKYLLIWRIFLLHVCVYWIMKKLIQEKYNDKNNHYIRDNQNLGTSMDKIEKLIDEFFKKEYNNFNYIPDKIVENNGITKQMMDEDYKNSIKSVKEYIKEWLQQNYGFTTIDKNNESS